MIAAIASSLVLADNAWAATDCIVDSKGQKQCRQVADDTGPQVGVFVGAGILLGVAITILWATRPARHRRGADIRRSNAAPVPEPDQATVDAWASDEGGGVMFEWSW